MSKRYWEKPITLRLTPYQRKVLSEIVDGAADAGACKGGLSPSESKALLSIHMRLIGATEAQAKIDEAAQPQQADGRGAVIELTPEMTLAGARSIGNTVHTDNHVARARDCWDAMMAARGGTEEPRPTNPGRALSQAPATDGAVLIDDGSYTDDPRLGVSFSRPDRQSPTASSPAGSTPAQRLPE